MANLLDDVPDERIEKELLDRRIRSIFDLAYTYGKLQLLADEKRLETQNISIHSDYLKYMTPSHEKITDLFDEPNTCVSVRLSWNEDDNSFKYQGLEFEQLSWSVSAKHGYCRPNNKSNQIAHSICQLTSTSGYDLENVASKLAERFTRWPSDEIVEDVRDTHPDGWIINALNEFGESTASTQSWISDVSEDITSKLSGQSKFTGLMSVKLDIDGTGEYVPPGEFDVLNEGMKQKKLDRLETLQMSGSKTSTGQGVCFITGEESKVYGLTPGSPANFYTGQQEGNFPNLDPSQSWRAKPLSSDAAMAVLKSATMFDEIGYAVSPDERIGYYPYYELMTPIRARDIYHQYMSLSDTDEIPAAVADWAERRSHVYPSVDSNKKRIYALLYEEDQASVYNILNEAKSCKVQHLHELFDEWSNVLSNPFIVKSVGGYTSEEDGYDWFLDDQRSQREFLETIFNGGFFKTVFEQVEYSGNTGGVFNLTIDLIAGRKVSYRKLLSEYVDNTIARQNWMLGEPNIESAIPSKLLIKQYIHHQILSNTDSISTELPAQSLLSYSENIDNVMFENRTKRLEAYLESHAALDDPERRSLFLLGGLVGRLSQYQRHKLNLSKTLAEQYPVNAVSRNRVRELTQAVLNKNVQYSEMKNVVINARYTDKLRESVLEKDLDEWKLSTNDARFYYSLGLSYGYSDYAIREDSSDVTETEEAVTQN